MIPATFPFCCFLHCCTLSSASVIRGMRDRGAIFFGNFRLSQILQVADEKQQHQDWQASDPGFVPWGRRLDAKRKEQQSRLGSSGIIKDPEWILTKMRRSRGVCLGCGLVGGGSQVAPRLPGPHSLPLSPSRGAKTTNT